MHPLRTVLVLHVRAYRELHCRHPLLPDLCGFVSPVWGCGVNHAWMADALCRDYSTDLFYPEGTAAERKEKAAAKSAVCNRCHVKEQREEYANKNGDPNGIWAGVERDGKPRKVTVFLSPHGTPGAVKRHNRDKEPLCGVCREYERIRAEVRREMRRRSA